MSDQHARFLKRLDASMPAVFAVAQMQHAKGRTVEIPALRRAPTAAEHEHYIDGGDLFVMVRHRIEVKWLRVNFTGADDWPFREVFVSNVASVDRANGEVAAYVSVSRDLHHVAIVERSTKPHWYVVEKLVSNTGNLERNYACPLREVIFEPLQEEKELAPFYQATA
jgi:hypothetical protein